ncbi:MAG: energy transducer TonB [Altererythrobacter sp.]|nr:energy transducer TonB [Altererythrobacter sp.]
MTYTAETSLLSRATAILFSAAIHAALGFALFMNFPAGTPNAGTRSGERGDVLVVELLPLPDGGRTGEGREQHDRQRREHAGLVDNVGARDGGEKKGPAERIGSPPRGDGGRDETSGMAGAQDDRSGAPALSGAEIQAFRARLLSHIERFRRYPPQAREAGQEGVVRIQFVMDRSGNVTEAWVELSSGSALLDQEAIAAVMRAQPLPTPPSNWPRAFGVALPIGFSLQ